MSDEFIELNAKAGTDCETELVYADVDTSVDPAVETPVDLTGYEAVMDLYRRDGDEKALTLTSNPAAGLTITAAEGVVSVLITYDQINTLLEIGERWIWQIILISPSDRRLGLADGTLNIARRP